ncbi:Calmodulin [Rhynchospora pubera]|uniref:Calmodulin n=1 Tax=Rhynchospora pubera TaxID=906938 RepID=A0AAV8FQ24_9POAL|nr:Calmodulin [Rhynchospora pubera]KAJ4792362.1 Calmodulin [Rhynchospora pubera]KAJ4816177.1 Calmodulin [Rhynchospora pubera]
MASANSSQSQPLSLNLEALSYINSLVEAFQAFDSDNNGLINTAELQGLLSSLGHERSEQDAKDMIAHASSTQNGQLSIEEFLETMNAGELGLDWIGDLFEAAVPVLGPAAGPGGMVNSEELATVLSMVGSASLEDCMEIISCLDGDGDGAVSVEEIKRMASLL